MPVVSVYKCPKCKRMWPVTKKSKYITHLRNHAIRNRFEKVEKKLKEEDKIFLKKVESVMDFDEFVALIKSTSILVLYKNLYFNLENRTNIILVRRLEEYFDKTIGDIFTDKTIWEVLNACSRRYDSNSFLINFGKTENLFLGEFLWREITPDSSMNVTKSCDGNYGLVFIIKYRNSLYREGAIPIEKIALVMADKLCPPSNTLQEGIRLSS